MPASPVAILVKNSRILSNRVVYFLNATFEHLSNAQAFIKLSLRKKVKRPYYVIFRAYPVYAANPLYQFDGVSV
jgi:hypothetical protein